MCAGASALRPALAAAVAVSSADEGGDGGPASRMSEQCCINLCSHQLLRCFGQKSGVASALGCAEESHVICAPCLERWFASHNLLRQQHGLQPQTRRQCPVCKCDLRAAGSATRADVHAQYRLGLLKVEGSW